MKYILVLLFFSGLNYSFTTNLLATSFIPSSKTVEFPDYNPFAKEGIFPLTSEDSYNLVNHCKIKPSENLEYWVLSENLIRLVDKRLNAYLKKLNHSLKKKHKQFFGMKTDSQHKFIYIFVYPIPSAAIDKEQGNHILLCSDISDTYIKVQFDYKSIMFSTL